MRRRTVLLLTIMAMALVAVASPAWAAEFDVNSTNDRSDKNPGDGECVTFRPPLLPPSGNECTLRAAIQEANALRGADIINFNIPGTGPHTIAPGSYLPEITTRVTIDGYSQSGASENTDTRPDKTNAVLKVELTGGFAMLSLDAGASNGVIKGLAIGNCSTNLCNSGIHLYRGTGYKVEGNFLGTRADGITKAANSEGVVLNGASGSTIGGASPAARNLISGNLNAGVVMYYDASANTIQGNLIGPNRDGTTTPNNLGNGKGGVELISAGNGNRILSNSILSNGGLGIDLNDDGVTPNDGQPDSDKDKGPNRLQNYPDLTFAQTRTFPGDTTIYGTLESTPSTRKQKRTFIIQFFSNPSADSSGYGEGKTFLGEKLVTTDRQGKATFSFGPSQVVPAGQYVTATATNKNTGDTSEFSNARIVEEPTFEQA
jgi:CSLREA domain-containing protein